MTAGVGIVEVSPRDGLQNESVRVGTDDKIELLHRLMDAGATRIEAVSFVSPRHVPQMADAEAVMAGLERRPGVSLAGLVLNERGLDRALAAGVDEINIVGVATEPFSRRNQGMSIAEMLASWAGTAERAKGANLYTTFTLGASFGCPFEGEVSTETVVDIVRRVVEGEPDEICLADTIGVGDPSDVTRKLAAVAEIAPGIPLRCHLHNTRNTGLANAYAAVQAGVQALDSSAGGIGGCPFAPAATGNIPTEDLVYMLHRMGIHTGLELPALLSVVQLLGTLLGRDCPGMLSRAGLFPQLTAA